VTEMPIELQVKLLRVLETGTFMRVGSDELFETDVRILAATNRDPTQAVATGKLREDLFYRLNVFQIHVPPLRERLEDVALLAEHFLKGINEREKTRRTYSADALLSLLQYGWPGNVRELRNVVQRAYIMAESDTIDVDCIPFDQSRKSADSALAEAAGASVRAGPTGLAGSQVLGVPVVNVPIGTSIADMEKMLILATVAACGGQKEKAAEQLGISSKTLYTRLREYAGTGD
jgi:two-component system, NtrC family, response regulator AtoC